MSALPPQGLPPEDVLSKLRAMGESDLDWTTGRVLSGLYEPTSEASSLAKTAYLDYLPRNALYVNFYPSITQMEKEVVRSVADLLQAGPGAAGNMTSGGTESIFLGVKVARDRARVERPEVTAPEMVLPVSAHPAFHKAAHYLGLTPVVTPMDLATYRADVSAVAAAVGENTVLVVASAPTYSHGVVDPIDEIAPIATAANAHVHVDACVGGIPLALLRGSGIESPAFDFSVPGVDTISADLHKYGYVPKNASTIVYRDLSLRRYAWYVNSATTEYAVINPTVQSTKTGGPVAAAWVMMQHLGLDGYSKLTEAVYDATQVMITGARAIGGIKVLGDPIMTMFTLASDEVNVFELDGAMSRRGWSLLPEFAAGGGPANLHVAVTWPNVGNEDAFVADLRAAVEEVRAHPRIDRAFLQSEVDAVAGAEPMEMFARLAPHTGLTGTGLPDDLGALNTILDLLPADVRDELLTDYANLLF